MNEVVVKTDGIGYFASMECGCVLLELSKDGDSPQCPRSWTWNAWYDGDYIGGSCEEASFADTVRDSIASFDGIIGELTAMRDYLASYEAIGKEPGEDE